MEMVKMECAIYETVFEVADRAAFLRRLRSTADECGTHIICFDAGKMAGRAHAESAIRHAWRAVSTGTLISNSFEMEALLYAAGTRQCASAGEFGVHDGVNHSYLCICPPADCAREALEAYIDFVDDDLDEISGERMERLMDLFSITPAELEAAGGAGRIRDLVLERVALLDAYK